MFVKKHQRKKSKIFSEILFFQLLTPYQTFSDAEKKAYEPFPKPQFLDASKLKKFAEDNFEFDENGREFFKKGRKNCVKRRNCS